MFNLKLIVMKKIFLFILLAIVFTSCNDYEFVENYNSYNFSNSKIMATENMITKTFIYNNCGNIKYSSLVFNISVDVDNEYVNKLCGRDIKIGENGNDKVYLYNYEKYILITVESHNFSVFYYLYR